MKLFISLILSTSIFNKVISADVNFHATRQSIQFEENIKNEAITRDVELPFPIPIEDTYYLDHAEFNLPGDIFSVNVNMSKASVSGVSGFRLLELNLSNSEPIIGLKILFPSLELHAEHYDLEGNIYNAVPIKVTGVAHMELYNLLISITVYLNQSPVGHAILLDKLEDAEIHVDRIVSRTEFDDNMDDIINALVEDLLADYINRFNKYLIATYSDTLIKYINTLLETPTN